MKKLKVFSFLLILIFSLFAAGFIFAQRPLEIEYPEAGGLRPETTIFGLSAYVKYIFNLSIIIAGLIAFAGFVAGGIKYITSTGIPAFKKDAGEQMFAAFVGLLVLLTSYMLLTSINPALTMLAGPEIIKITPEFVETPTLEKETLSYTEIPVGALIQELFLEERLDNLKTFSKKVRDISNKIEQKTKELNSIIAQCSCDKAHPNCSGNNETSCLAGYCSGDPCLNKNAIKLKRNEIEELINNEEDGLIYWQKKLDREINGSSEEEDEYIGFRQIYEDLLSAEEMMKKCSATASANGKPQFLVAYKDFWVYQQYMAEKYMIEQFYRERPFEYIRLPNHPFEPTTFYCSEMLYSVVPIEIDEDLIAELGKEIEISEAATLCSNEIFIGKDVDSTEELARRMLVELDDINNNAKEEINNEIVSTADPNECIISTCSSNCQWIEKQCIKGYYCCGGYDDEGNCMEWCPEWEDCSECKTYPCTGSVCPGDQPKKSQINSQYNQIKENDSEISSSYIELVNLIQENVSDKFLKISNIFKSLRTVQSQTTACHNPKESYIKLEEGRESIVWREFFLCSDIKEFATRETPFYDEEGDVINDCYGPTSDNLDFMDNLFCCKGEYGPE